MKHTLLFAGLALALNAALAAWTLRPYYAAPPTESPRLSSCLFCDNPQVQRAIREAESRWRQDLLGDQRRMVTVALVLCGANVLLVLAALRRKPRDT